jgi:hypothetical protein
MPSVLSAISTRILLLASLAGLCGPGPLQALQRHDSGPRGVSGRVVNGQDQPLAKAVVYLKDTKSLAIRTYITQEDGIFRFSGLAPNADYEVYADYEGGHSQVRTISAFDEHQQVQCTLKIKRTR